MSLRYQYCVAAFAALAFAAPLSAQQQSPAESAGVASVTSTILDAPALVPPLSAPVFEPTPTLASSLGLTVVTPAQQTASGEADGDPVGSLFQPTAPVVGSAPVSDYDAASAMAPSSNAALMIVGVAALIAGSLVDGDSGTIIMVGGAVVGLIGLYRYLG